MSNQDTFRHITAEDFSRLDFSTVTLLDLREPDEVLIHQEELIDGVELGGVSTFLGSGEESDMSLFI